MCIRERAYPKDGTGWMKLAGRIREHWSHYGQMDAADEIMEDMGKRYTACLLYTSRCV